MLSHRKVIAFTKKRVRNHHFSHPLSVFYPLFSPRLHLLPDMILIKQWQKCPIEAFVLEHEVFPQIAQMDTDFYLRTRTKGRWPKGKAITRMTRIISHRYHRYTQILFRTTDECGLHGLHELFFYRNYQKLTMRSALLCQAKHHIVLSGDAFLRSVGAQALRGGLAKNYQEL